MCARLSAAYLSECCVHFRAYCTRRVVVVLPSSHRRRRRSRRRRRRSSSTKSLSRSVQISRLRTDSAQYAIASVVTARILVHPEHHPPATLSAPAQFTHRAVIYVRWKRAYYLRARTPVGREWNCARFIGPCNRSSSCAVLARVRACVVSPYRLLLSSVLLLNNCTGSDQSCAFERKGRSNNACVLARVFYTSAALD